MNIKQQIENAIGGFADFSESARFSVCVGFNGNRWRVARDWWPDSGQEWTTVTSMGGGAAARTVSDRIAREYAGGTA